MNAPDIDTAGRPYHPQALAQLSDPQQPTAAQPRDPQQPTAAKSRAQ